MISLTWGKLLHVQHLKWPSVSPSLDMGMGRLRYGWSAIVEGAIDNQPRRPKKMSRPSLARTPSSRCHSSKLTPLLAHPPPPRHRRSFPASASLLFPLRSWLDIADYPRVVSGPSSPLCRLSRAESYKKAKK